MDVDTAARIAALEAAQAIAMAGLMRGLVAAKAIDVRVAEDIMHATVDMLRSAGDAATAGATDAAATATREAFHGLAEEMEQAAFHLRR